MKPLAKKGKIITFYSYKGGTGRSMALANIACLLVRQQNHGQGVLMIDWDLEAPGLHRFFKKLLPATVGSDTKDAPSQDTQPGLIDFFTELDHLLPVTKTAALADTEILSSFDKLELDRYILETKLPGLFLLKAGRFDENYNLKVNRFQWEALYQKCPTLMQNLADYLSHRFSYILIDSRTGITDIGGVCTMLMPEILVVVFTPNQQSLLGVLGVIQQATRYRTQSSDLRPLIVYPLVSRVDASEPQLRETWRFGDERTDIVGFQTQFEKLFTEIYELETCDLNEYFNEVQIQHIPRYAYGEEIAVLIERAADRFSLTASYQSFLNRLLYLSGPWEPYSASKFIREEAVDDSDTFKKSSHIKKQKYAVYFSYSEEIQAEILPIVKELQHLGIRPWLNTPELRPGDDWKKGIQNLIEQTEVAVVFIGPKGLNKRQTEELAKFIKSEKRIIPVFVEGAESKIALPEFLKNLSGIAYKKDDRKAIAKLIWGITGKRSSDDNGKD